MVNIGGRSRGCPTCIRRRVKCDEQRPRCRQCVRLNLHCAGPPEDMSFIEAKIVRSRRTIRKTDDGQATSSNASNSMSPAPTALPVSSFKSTDLEVYIYHADKNLCLGGTVNAALREIQVLDWTSATHRLTHQAILTFATITFGTQQKQSTIVNRGYAMYSKTVQRLNQTLSEPMALSDDTFLVVATLAYLEILVPSGMETHEHHIDGLERLLTLRAGMPLSPDMCRLYRFVRALIIFSSIRRGTPFAQRSPLTGAEWKIAFRLHCGTDRDVMEQDLYDALAECTSLAVVVRQWPLDLGKLEVIMRSIIAHLYDFRERCSSDPDSEVSRPPANWTCALQSLWQSGPPFTPTPPYEQHRPRVDLLMLYYLVFIHILRVLSSIPQDQRVLLPAVKSDTRDWITSTLRSAALLIHACVPHYRAEKWHYRSGSSPHAYWALGTAWETLGGNRSIAGRRLRDVLDGQKDDVNAKVVWG